MKQNKSPSSETVKLRVRAEQRLRVKKVQLHRPGSEKDAKRLVHELEVHQIELEMQNAELRRAQEELELSRNNYINLYDFAPVGYFTFDTQGLILEVNLTGAKLLGLERRLLIKKPFSNFIAQAAERDIFSKHREEVFQKQDVPTCEIHLKRKDGSIFPAQLQSVAKENTEGHAGNIHTTIIDVTGQKQIEQALRDSERLYRAIGESIDYGVWVCEPGGRNIYASDSFLKLVGLTQKQCSDFGWGDVLHPNDIEATLSKWKECVRTEGVWDIEHRYHAVDGHWHPILARGVPVRNDDGKIIYWAGINLDISRIKQAEQELRKSEEYFKEITENSSDVIIITDKKGNIKYCSRSAERFFGYKPEELLGRNGFMLIHPDDLERAVDDFGKATLTADTAIYNQFRIVRKDGSISYFDGVGKNLLDHPAVEGFVMNVHDVTQRKQAEQSLLRAHDELEKRVEERTAELQIALSEIETMKDQLEAENIYFRHEHQIKHSFENIIGESEGLKYVLHRAEQVAPANTTVLILGETGTGKELIAAAIHHLSPRKERPLITVNCAALPSNLIESELFGREKGAFTGADTRRMGRFEIANGSTLCLDEIGELPLELQIKLLRVIQHHEFERLGSSNTIKVDVRIIATTNRNLEKEVSCGRFRQDLYYRLNVFPITVPPLRQRQGDIPLMVQSFVERYSRKMGKQITTISKETLQTLHDYPWPGNVRELESIIERAVILCQGPVLHLADKLEISSPAMSSAVRTLEETERNQMLKILSETKWRIEGKEGAAMILGLNASTLRARMHKLGIVRPQAKKQN